MAEIVVSVLLVLGAALALVGSWGVVVLPRFLSRIHGPSVVITGGLGTLLLASLIWFWFEGGRLTGRELLVSFVLAVTAPITGHALSRAWLARHPKDPVDLGPGRDDG